MAIRRDDDGNIMRRDEYAQPINHGYGGSGMDYLDNPDGTGNVLLFIPDDFDPRLKQFARPAPDGSGRLVIPSNVYFNEANKLGYGLGQSDFMTNMPKLMALAGLTAGAGGFLDPYSISAGGAGVGGAAPVADAVPSWLAPNGGNLTGPLASPDSVATFLQTVPNAVPGTQLPVGGTMLDITLPGSVAAGTAAGNAIVPGMMPAPTVPVGGAPVVDLSPLPQGGLPPASTGTTIPTIPPTTPPQGKTSDIGKQVAGAVASSAAGSLLDGGEVYDPTADLAATEAERQSRIRQASLDIDSAFGGFNDDFYSGVASAYRDYQTPMLTEQYQGARRALPLSMRSTANSAYARKAGELERDYGRAQTDIARQGEDVANQQRANVERERGNLQSQAEMGAGLDSAASQAASVARSLAQPPAFSPIGDLFAKYTANLANARLAQNQGFRSNGTRPLLFNNPPRSSYSVSYG